MWFAEANNQVRKSMAEVQNTKLYNTKVTRILIANRGEIALRVIRAAKDLGLETVAIFSEADAQSLHVQMADYCVGLQGHTSQETYLNIPKILDAIKRSGADAVHPGYGFLSENSHFADEVTKIGAKFIGPSSRAMNLMGDKIEAKRLMKSHKVPCTPGSENPIRDLEDLKSHSKTVGYPMILKASAGGGGRGMRIVRQDSDLADAFAACTREAQSYFGNPDVFCERYLENPRHIEVQVLFDEHGHGVHLFERDCSVQRRHQKLVEEAPSTFLSHDMRMEIGRRAVVAAKAAGYSSAGTIEFICESPEKIYFMEMNTRIQVEHTVSEEISGVDLVKWQIRVARGEHLTLQQDQLEVDGWCIEVRINAEDASKGFMPTAGLVRHVRFPSGPGVRVDSHLYSGYEIPQFYDSMVAKIIVWGESRSEAIARMLRALREFEIDGVTTTASFHEAVLRHPKFLSGDFNTGFVEREIENLINDFKDPRAADLEQNAMFAAIHGQIDLEQEAQLPLATTAHSKGTNKWTDAAIRSVIQGGY